MSTTQYQCLVAQIVVRASSGAVTYYVTDRDGITLDSINYLNVVASWGDYKAFSPIGEKSRTGGMSIKMLNGERFLGGGYLFDNTASWNNQTVTVRRWSYGDDEWVDCDAYCKGIIKGFAFGFGYIQFDIDDTDTRDTVMFPRVVIDDQTGLADADAQCSIDSDITAGGSTATCDATDVKLFMPGELVLIYDNLSRELAQIKSISGTTVTFMEPLVNDYNAYSPGSGVMEKAFRNAPKKSIGKTLPVQIGDLTSKSSGIFAKGLTINAKIGEQEIIFDSISAKQFTISDSSGIGLWEDGLRRFFFGKYSGEYQANNRTTGVQFKADTTTTLNSGFSTSGAEGQEQIEVADGTKLLWDTETASNKYTETAELLGANVLAIDNELMLVLEKPNTSDSPHTVWVERAFNNTTPTVHDNEAKIFQSAKYALRNLLSFTERFNAVGVANQYYEDNASNSTVNYDEPDEYFDTTTSPPNGKLSLICDSDSSTYAHLQQNISNVSNEFGNASATSRYNFDLKFGKIEGDYTVTGVYVSLKADVSLTMDHGGGLSHLLSELYFFDPYVDTNYDQDADGSTDSVQVIFAEIGVTDSPATKSFDAYSTISRASITEGAWFEFQPNLIDDVAHSISGLTSLTCLNRKWKCSFKNHLDNAGYVGSITGDVDFKIYEIGLWVDFFIDFSAREIMATLKGRKITADVLTVTGDLSPSRSGNAAELITDVLVLLLMQEGGYTTTDFTDSWETITANRANSIGAESICAFSYGVNDERKPIWDFCQELASHFCLALTKTGDGKIDVVDLRYFQTTEVTGNEISIDSILFEKDSGQRRITIEQTGVDQIYNDVVVNWNRNNSTGNYQSTYTVPPNAYLDYQGVVTPEYLYDVRTRYYGGQKRTLTIDSPFIYNEDAAQDLAEFHINDKSQPHLFVTFALDYEHYSVKNSLSEQYKIGDVIYLTGRHAGIEFNTANKFVVMDCSRNDSGREIQLACKSLQPTREFTSLAV